MVTGASVSVNFFMKIREIDQIKDDIKINSPPKFSDKSGLKTINVPIKPISKAEIRLIFIFSFKKNIAKKVPKIGTVKLSAVTCDNVVRVSP